MEAFFVISSFFLVKKYYGNDEIKILQQFKHRIIRLYPPYIVVLILSSLYAVIVVRQFPYDILTHLFSVQNFHWMITGYSSPMQYITAHTWTLSIEVWVGVIWLCILKFINNLHFKQAMYICLLTGILYRVITILFHCDPYIVSLCPIAHFDAFSLGALLAILVKEKKLKLKNCVIVGLIGIFGVTMCILYLGISDSCSLICAYESLSSSKNYLSNVFTGNIYLFISLFTVGLVGILILRDENNADDTSNVKNAFITLGGHSYVLYLFHWPIRVAVHKFMPEWYVLFPLVLILTLLLCFFYNQLLYWIRERLGRMVS